MRFLAFIFAFFSYAAYGSALLPTPECLLDVDIFEHVEATRAEPAKIVARLHNARPTGSGILDRTLNLIDSNCSQYESEKAIIFSRGTQYAKTQFPRITNMTVGVQSYSSNGEGGAVSALHWEVMSLEDAGTQTPENLSHIFGDIIARIERIQ